MDVINMMHYFAALLFVLALAGAALLVKRYGSNPQAFRDSLNTSLGGKLGKWDFKIPERRLAVVETLMLGPKQRLLITRRPGLGSGVCQRSRSLRPGRAWSARRRTGVTGLLSLDALPGALRHLSLHRHST